MSVYVVELTAGGTDEVPADRVQVIQGTGMLELADISGTTVAVYPAAAWASLRREDVRRSETA